MQLGRAFCRLTVASSFAGTALMASATGSGRHRLHSLFVSDGVDSHVYPTAGVVAGFLKRMCMPRSLLEDRQSRPARQKLTDARLRPPGSALSDSMMVFPIRYSRACAGRRAAPIGNNAPRMAEL